VSGCGHVGDFFFCGLVSLGTLRGSGHALQDGRQVALPYFAVGGRVGAGWPVLGPAWLRLHLDVVGLPLETTLDVGSQAIWTTPRVAAALGFAVLFDLI
jgi:hypothetical protein